MSKPPQIFTHGDCTVGWVCVLPETELSAAWAMLDEKHSILPAADPQDMNVYVIGRIGDHNVVITCLPAETTGKASAATVANNMIRNFEGVRFGLMVGAGGGPPYYSAKDNSSAEEGDSRGTQDIRLSDFVISLHSKTSGSVLQYDFGKLVQGKELSRIGGNLNKPPNIVLAAVATLKAQHMLEGHKISDQQIK